MISNFDSFLIPPDYNFKSLNEMTYCTQVELPFRPKLASYTHKSFKIRVKK